MNLRAWKLDGWILGEGRWKGAGARGGGAHLRQMIEEEKKGDLFVPKLLKGRTEKIYGPLFSRYRRQDQSAEARLPGYPCRARQPLPFP